MKQCKRCGEVKPLEAFAKRKAAKDGREFQCRACKAAYREENRKQEQARNKAWREGNCERVAVYLKDWHQANPDYAATYNKAWVEANRPRKLALESARRAGLQKATPAWLSKEQRDAIAAIYAEAERLTRETGIPHHVDHIIPLKGRGVCGLHVPWNLRAIPASENITKKNKLLEEAW